MTRIAENHAAIVNNKRLFKGNVCSIITNDEGIRVINSYYLDRITQRYKINSNTTRLKFNIRTQRGKWVQELVTNIHTKFWSKSNYNMFDHEVVIDIPSEMIKLEKYTGIISSVKVKIHHWSDSELSFIIEAEGLRLMNAWDSLSILKEVRRLHSHLLNNLKKKVNDDSFISGLESKVLEETGTIITNININKI